MSPPHHHSHAFRIPPPAGDAFEMSCGHIVDMLTEGLKHRALVAQHMVSIDIEDGGFRRLFGRIFAKIFRVQISAPLLSGL